MSPIYGRRSMCYETESVIGIEEFCSSSSPRSSWKPILDHSQETAIKTCLSNRIAIVQGPPGTGKTFLGLKLMNILNSISTEPTTPILVLTYKNHSLDEFLKELLKAIPNSVARVGGRSQDSELAQCNLRELRAKIKMPEDSYRQVQELRNLLAESSQELEAAFKELDASTFFHPDTLIEHLSEDQIKQFLLNCPWFECGKVGHQLKDATDEDGFTMAGGKVSKKVVLSKLKQCENIPMSRILMGKDSHTNLKHDIYELLKAAVKRWVPSNSVFSGLDASFATNRVAETLSKSIKQVADPQLETDSEKDAEEVEKERIASAKHGILTKELLLQQMVMFNQTKPSGKKKLIRLSAGAKEISKQMSPAALLGIADLWQMAFLDRAKLIQVLLFQQYQESGKRFEEVLKEVQSLVKTKEELENHHKATILKGKRIIGMTITGANINYNFITELKPEIVIVEEAGEVLEPQIMALLGNWTKHLILIGDHMQLRPSVENYLLCRNYHLDVSMMERLIHNGLPYATLSMQNRMRPEFAELLLDIYPKLESNHDRVNKNAPANCFGSSMFFWDHDDPETSTRSFINEKEAEKAIKLAMFLIFQGYKPEKVTILSPYLGQVRLLRKLMKKEEEKFPEIFQSVDNTEKDTAVESKQLQTLGVSKGKSNNESIKMETAENEVKKTVSIHTVDLYQGDENDFVIISLVRNNQSGKIGFVGTLNRRCVAQSRSRCGLYFIGSKTCLTASSSSVWCSVLSKLEAKGCVGRQFPVQCPKHPERKFLAEAAEDIPLEKSFCNYLCNKVMNCGRHRCPKKCQPRHNHTQCQKTVAFDFKSCGHPGTKKCYENEHSIRCETIIDVKLSSCEHRRSGKCHQKSAIELKPCDEDVLVTFPACGHSCICKCREKGSVKCDEPCARKLKCKHPCELKCAQECDSKECSWCLRVKAEIEKVKVQQERAKKQRYVEEIEERLRNMRNEPDLVHREELSPDGDTAAKYLNIEDMVTKYIHPQHKWFPQVTRIEKISNITLEKKWLTARKNLHDPFNAELKFHGTNEEAVESIIKNGFKLPESGRQMFGKGIYFATDSSKSAQDRYTHGSNMLLVCEVLLGKSFTVASRTSQMTLALLRRMGYDSLFAKRDTKDKGGVYNDEFVVYDPDQAIVRYIVHYKATDYNQMPLTKSLTSKVFARFDILPPKRAVRYDDPEQVHFRLAESQFLRLMRRLNYHKGQVILVQYYVNPTLEVKFNKMQALMKAKYPTSEESEFILAFHGTNPGNIDSIVQNNFDIGKLGASTGNQGYYGAGIYFSEFPDVSMGYGASGKLLLCRVLPGKTYACTGPMVGSKCTSGYDSHGFQPDLEGRFKELVIFNADQILPCYVINYTT